jgi:RNA polymerase sigma-70 factor, ECF subfamily
MSENARAQLERDIRVAFEVGAFDGAATMAIRGYGPEILGYLTVAAGSHSDASEAFSMFCEDMWKGLPKFEWLSSFRSWAYVLAKNALHRYHRIPAGARWRNIPLEEVAGFFDIEQEVRTSTLMHLRTEAKSAISELREQLEERDRTLLTLRVDRHMSWQDIAVMLNEQLGPASADEVRRQAAACRKRFERAKERLRRLAEARGLL